MKIIALGAATPGTSLPATAFRIAVRHWQRHVVRLFDPYRPELHYMRGPGPARRAKRGMNAPFRLKPRDL